jgi:hypothetical protein
MSKDRLVARFVLSGRKYFFFTEWDKDDRAFALSVTDGQSVFKHEGRERAMEVLSF